MKVTLNGSVNKSIIAFVLPRLPYYHWRLGLLHSDWPVSIVAGYLNWDGHNQAAAKKHKKKSNKAPFDFIEASFVSSPWRVEGLCTPAWRDLCRIGLLHDLFSNLGFVKRRWQLFILCFCPDFNSSLLPVSLVSLLIHALFVIHVWVVWSNVLNNIKSWCLNAFNHRSVLQGDSSGSAAVRMSSVGQTQGSAVQDSGADIHNQENMLSRLRGATKNRIENRENVNPKAGSRTVLGALENNQRRQPVLRAAKVKQVRARMAHDREMCLCYRQISSV